METDRRTIIAQGSYQNCMRALSHEAVKNKTHWLIIRNKQHHIKYKCAQKNCKCKSELISSFENGDIIWHAVQIGNHQQHTENCPKPLKEYLIFSVAKSMHSDPNSIYSDVGMRIPKYTINRIKREKLPEKHWESLWRKLPHYIDLLNKKNSTAEILKNDKNEIESIFIMMPYAKNFCSSDAFLSIIFLDGTFCYDHLNSTLLAAVTVTADRFIIPLAAARTSGETKENYTYFLKKMSEFIMDSETLIFFSDQHPAIQSSISITFPLSMFVPCAWHVSKHLRCPSIVFFELLKSDHPILYEKRWELFEKSYPSSASKVREIIQKMAYIGNNRAKLGYITDSPIESFNSAILNLRDKEPLILLDGILRWGIKQCSAQILSLGNNLFCKTVSNKIKLRKEALNSLIIKDQSDSTYIVTEIYKGSIEISYLVKEINGVLECDCKDFDREGIPCRHEYAVSERFGLRDKLRTISLFNHSAIIRNALEYEFEIPSLGLLKESEIPIPQINKRPGRPKKMKRLKSFKETAKKTRKCSCCNKMVFHNKRTCPERFKTNRIALKESQNSHNEDINDSVDISVVNQNNMSMVLTKRKKATDMIQMRKEKIAQKENKRRIFPSKSDQI